MKKQILHILKEATENKWPYPKTFDSLKKAGLQSYHVYFENTYQSIFTTNLNETFLENSLNGYESLKSSKVFSKDGVQGAIVRHIQEQTNYVDFLADIASNGASHYKVDMEKRTVTYFNPAESEFYEEHVPKI